MVVLHFIEIRAVHEVIWLLDLHLLRIVEVLG